LYKKKGKENHELIEEAAIAMLDGVPPEAARQQEPHQSDSFLPPTQNQRV
jgi:hypothetical protein